MEMRGPNAFKTRLKCTCREIVFSVTRQTCTWNCPVQIQIGNPISELICTFCIGAPLHVVCSDCRHNADTEFVRNTPDTFNLLKHVMRAILSVGPKCSHRCVSLKETPLKPVQILKHTTKNSAKQSVMRIKRFKHIAI